MTHKYTMQYQPFQDKIDTKSQTSFMLVSTQKWFQGKGNSK